MLLDERGQGVLRLGAHGQRDPRRDEVEGDERRVVSAGDRVGEAERELGVRAAADRDEDALEVAEPRCLTTAMSHGDSRRTSSIVGEKTVGPACRAPPASCRPSRRR